jgi:hypothetical protein
MKDLLLALLHLAVMTAKLCRSGQRYMDDWGIYAHRVVARNSVDTP